MDLLASDASFDIKQTEDAIKNAGLLFGLVTLAAMVCGLITLCFAKFYFTGMGNCCNKFYICISFSLFITLGIVWIIIAIVFALPGLIVDDMETNCKAIQVGDKSKMKLNVGQEVDYSDVYEAFEKIDDQVGRGIINKFMCSDFCICPGTPESAHYKLYQKEEKEIIASGRSLVGFDSTEIKFERFGKKDSPLIWSFDPATG